jgi:CHASE2 domain-containing sensor protein/predicted Ser/Thr protein kinase
MLAAALASIGIGLAVHASGALNSLELSSIDARFGVRGTQRPRQDVVVVGVDAASIAAIGVAPTPGALRPYYARAINRLHADGARLIAMDLQFEGASTRGNDLPLVAAITRARPVVLATHNTDEQGDIFQLLKGVPGSGRMGEVLGSVGVQNDSDGKIRRMAFAPVSPRLVTLPVAAAGVLLGHPVTEAHFPGNFAWIDYAGPPGTLPTYSFRDLISGRLPPSTFANKTVLIGITDPAEKDVFATPTSSTPMAGTEVVANQLDTILDGFPLRPAGGAINILLIVLLGGLPALVGWRRPALVILLVSAIAAALLLVGIQIAFDHGRIVALTSPLLALLVSAVGSSAVDFFIETRARRSLEESIDRLVAQVKPGDVIGGYLIDVMVARGGMGVIYRATQVELARDVALKVIAPELASDERFRERFKREALMAASVQHPNVVPVYEAGEDHGLLFLAMRFIDGTDLRTLLADDGRLAPARVARLVEQIAEALDAAHAAGLVHRDVKPANVLIASESGHEHAYLTDFGLTKHTDASSSMTQTGMFVGTVDYVSPEQLRGPDVDGRADIYSLACICFELLTGRPPFVRDSEIATMFAHASSPVPSASELRPELGTRVDAVIARGMAKSADERYRTAGELARELAEALAGVGSGSGAGSGAGAGGGGETRVGGGGETRVPGEGETRVGGGGETRVPGGGETRVSGSDPGGGETRTSGDEGGDAPPRD